jgi:hypothetical protein
MALLTDAPAASLHPFVTAHVADGATVITERLERRTGPAGGNRLRHTRDPSSTAAP